MTSSNKKAYWEQRGRVAWLYLNYPETRNALGNELVSDSVACLDEIRGRDDIGVVCLTGGGGVGSWCAGMNLRELGRLDPSKPPIRVETLHDTLRFFPKPVMAVVNGYCLGGGISLLANCDLGIAGDKALFGLPEVARGGPPGRAIGEILHTIPQKYAFDLILSGRNWDAQKAMQAGLVTRVVPQDELETVAQEWASDIASFDPNGLMYCKRVMHRILNVLPRDQRIELNTLGNQEMRAAGFRGMFGESRESALNFLKHEEGTKATRSEIS
jgi:trans-feruloyl-CoA hydratase/vanillin synthase